MDVRIEDPNFFRHSTTSERGGGKREKETLQRMTELLQTVEKINMEDTIYFCFHQTDNRTTICAHAILDIYSCPALVQSNNSPFNFIFNDFSLSHLCSFLRLSFKCSRRIPVHLSISVVAYGVWAKFDIISLKISPFTSIIKHSRRIK